jgi:D-glycero-alpha-D-manno-heptose-7-phosphate kinase
MLISKTPLRVSFFGGGTDFPEYFKKKKTRVIGTAIDKFIYLFQSKFYSNLFDHNLRIFYRENEFVKNIKQINHKVFRQVLHHENVYKNIEIHTASEMPSFVGLGTSSSLLVGLLNIINFYKNKKNLNKKKLADKAIFFERVILKEHVGYQDQILAAFGGLNSVEFFGENYKIKNIEPLFNLKKFNNNLHLIYTGIQRKASNVEQKKIKKIKKNFSYLDTISDISEEAYKCFLKNKKTDFFGKLLHETWLQKKKLHRSVSNQIINNIYEKAIEAGALGGKLLGAGAGGFVLFYVEDNKRDKFLKAFSESSYIKFNFEKNGSKIIRV